MFEFSLLIQGFSLGFTALVSPGPFQAFLINETLTRGWRRTLPIIFAPLISDAPVVLLVLLILGQLSSSMLRLIQIAGGLFILYLAWGMFKQLRQGDLISTRGEEPGKSGLWRAVMLNLFNPGPYIFWSTINGPIVVRTWNQSPLAAVVFVGGFYGVLVGGLVGYIAVFHQARRLDGRIIRNLLALSLVIMAAFGVLLLRSGLLG